MKWIKTEDTLPTGEFMKQIDVMMYSPGWAGAISGLYTHLPGCEKLENEISVSEEWSAYDQQNDRYIDLEVIPKYWCEITLPDD